MATDRVISVKFPEGMLEEIDQEVDKRTYANRSDFIKAACRAQINYLYERRKFEESERKK